MTASVARLKVFFDRFSHVDLSSLQTVVAGIDVFCNVKSIVMKGLLLASFSLDLRSLESIELGRDAFTGRMNSSLVLKDLPSLETISSEGNAFRNVTSLTLSSNLNGCC